MRCHTARVPWVVLWLVCALTPATSAQSVFRAFLTDSQVTTSPPSKPFPLNPTGSLALVVPAGLGTFYLDPFANRLSYNVVIKQPLLGTILSADVHVGAVGHDGPRQFSLEPAGNDFAGKSPVLTATQVGWLQDNELYVTVKTTSAPEGLIRGQITPANKSFSARLTGANVVPPAQTSSVALVSAGYEDTSGEISYFHFLNVSANDAVHLHEGKPGTHGPISKVLSTLCPFGCQTTDITDLQVAKLRAGMYYIDVHTAAFPDGEMRGQLLPTYLEYGTGCPGTLPFPPIIGGFSGGFSVGFGIPNGVGLLFVGTVGADQPLGGGACHLGILTAAPYVAAPVVLDMHASTGAGLPSLPGQDIWFYVQYVGLDPGAPAGMHTSSSLGIHFHD